MTAELDAGVFNQAAVLAVIGGLAVTIVLVLLVIICVCFQKEKQNSQRTGQENPTLENVDLLRNGKVESDNVKLDVDTGVTPLVNGQATYDNNISGNLKLSPGSPQQASHRKLPAPPPGGVTAPVVNLAARLEDDDYDHLSRNNRKKSTKDHHVNYDHVTLNSDGQFQIVEGIKSQAIPDDYYAEVKTENIYAGVKGDENDPENDDYDRVKEGASKSKEGDTAALQDGEFVSNITIDDTYSRVKDESKEASQGSSKDIDPYTRVKDDPYAKVKDKGVSQIPAKHFDPYSTVKDDPYSKVKEKENSQGVVKDIEPFDPYNSVKDDCDSEKSFDPYNKVKDDPYTRVKGDNPYNKVKGDDDDDPYNKVNGDDDPYNKVSGDDLEQDDLGEGASGGIEDHYSKVDPNRKNQNNVTRIDIKGDNSGSGNLLSPEFNVASSNNEYAVVVKNFNDKANNLSVVTNSSLNTTSEEIDPYTLPPEPPRRYGSEEIRGIAIETGTSPTQPSPRNSREIPLPPAGGAASPPMAANNQQEPVQAVEPPRRREPPYSKLTARESMASINARRALNTYETVAETENFYATVEGGSGDGVITPKVAAGATSQKRSSHLNEDYAEIGATGGPNVNVPAPPSLDSLHSMTKLNPGSVPLSQEEEDLIDERYASVDKPKSPGSVSNPRLSGNLTGARFNVINDMNNQSVHPPFGAPGVNPPLGASGDTDIVLSPNYQTVKDFIPEDNDTDPNYESVEEAKAKVGYESQEMKAAMMERKKRTHVYEEVKPSPESVQVKTRVLRSHMYEDIDEVKEQKNELKRRSKDDDVWKRRSDVEKE